MGCSALLDVAETAYLWRISLSGVARCRVLLQRVRVKLVSSCQMARLLSPGSGLILFVGDLLHPVDEGRRVPTEQRCALSPCSKRRRASVSHRARTRPRL